MVQPIVMPKLGQMVDESKLVRWLKKEGDQVRKGEPLFELETDKAQLEAESFHEGTLLKIVVREGLTVAANSVVGFLGTPGEAVPDVQPVCAAPKPQHPAAAAASAIAAAVKKGAPVAAAAPAAGSQQPAAVAPPRFSISPRAKRLAREKAIDPSGIAGSGPNGRVVEKDVLGYLESRGYSSLRFTPTALELASAEGIDVLRLAGSGDGGRITRADVEEAVSEKPREMTRLRQVIAERLTASFTSIPHFYVTVSADLTGLVALRAELKARGQKLTVTDFLMKAVAEALQEFPNVNSTTDGRTVSRRSRVHLGVAVSLENGLVVPVVRNAGKMSVEELSSAAAALVERARAGKLLPDEMQGGTFTISNMGMLDVENFSAIINPGESAILAVSSARPTPVVVDGAVAVRTMMKMTVSADHRIVDGAEAARFVNAIRQKLENVERWKSLTS